MNMGRDEMDGRMIDAPDRFEPWDYTKESIKQFLHRNDAHYCDDTLPFNGYGEAITSCLEDTLGRLICGNDEYGSQVNFCPYCGFEAKNKVK